MDERTRSLLEADLEERSVATLSERRKYLGRSLGQRVHHEQDGGAPRMEPKKRSLGVGERDEFLRAAWRLMGAKLVNADRLVFVDEMGTNVSPSPLYAW